MARGTVTKSAGVGSYPVTPVAADAMDLALTAADPVNKNQIAFGSAVRLFVFFINTHVADAGNVTIEGSLDGQNRDAEITDYSLAAGEMGFFIAPRNGWRQADGYLYLDGSAADIKFGAVEI